MPLIGEPKPRFVHISGIRPFISQSFTILFSMTKKRKTVEFLTPNTGEDWMGETINSLFRIELGVIDLFHDFPFAIVSV